MLIYDLKGRQVEGAPGVIEVIVSVAIRAEQMRALAQDPDYAVLCRQNLKPDAYGEIHLAKLHGYSGILPAYSNSTLYEKIEIGPMIDMDLDDCSEIMGMVADHLSLDTALEEFGNPGRIFVEGCFEYVHGLSPARVYPQLLSRLTLLAGGDAIMFAALHASFSAQEIRGWRIACEQAGVGPSTLADYEGESTPYTLLYGMVEASHCGAISGGRLRDLLVSPVRVKSAAGLTEQDSPATGQKYQDEPKACSDTIRRHLG